MMNMTDSVRKRAVCAPPPPLGLEVGVVVVSPRPFRMLSITLVTVPGTPAHSKHPRSARRPDECCG